MKMMIMKFIQKISFRFGFRNPIYKYVNKTLNFKIDMCKHRNKNNNKSQRQAK